MYIPTDSEITLMDEFLGRYKMHDDFCKRTAPTTEDDKIKNLVVELSSYINFAKNLSGSPGCIRYNIDTQRFIESGGFSWYFDKLNEKNRITVEREQLHDRKLQQELLLNDKMILSYKRRYLRIMITAIITFVSTAGGTILINQLSSQDEIKVEPKDTRRKQNSIANKPSSSHVTIPIDSSSNLNN